MAACLGGGCSFGLPRVPFVGCCQFVYLIISLLVLRAGCGIWLYQFLIIAYLFTSQNDRGRTHRALIGHTSKASLLFLCWSTLSGSCSVDCAIYVDTHFSVNTTVFVLRYMHVHLACMKFTIKCMKFAKSVFRHSGNVSYFSLLVFGRWQRFVLLIQLILRLTVNPLAESGCKSIGRQTCMILHTSIY